METKEIITNADESMQLAVEYLDETLSHIRAGKASPKLLDGIRVEYYGSLAPISNVANISVPDARPGKNRCSRRSRRPSSTQSWE